MKLPSIKLSALALALTLAGLAPSAQALSFSFKDVSSNGGMTSEQLGAFQSAANYWSGKFTDNVTVYINIAFNNLGANILGTTGSNNINKSYDSVRSSLTADAKSSLDFSAVSHLQSGPALTFQSTQMDLSSRLNNDNSVNNKYLELTTANAKALGYTTGTSAANADANITFATGFANSFSYTGAAVTGKTDFVTVAEHEIGHALGFVSGVDTVDYCAGAANACGLSSSGLENYAVYSPLDLFRYSAAGVLDLRVGGSPYFSIDGGATSIESFSTGSSAHGGNDWQASHFGTNHINLMRPFIGTGQAYGATASDMAAFDAIGWDVAVAVPEPQTYALMLLGLGFIGGAARRRARKAS
ncbi:NF038122 family metalloprotease [Roseateles sp. GG27B]